MLALIRTAIFLISVIFAAAPGLPALSQTPSEAPGDAPADAPAGAPLADPPPDAPTPAEAPSEPPAAIVHLSGDRFQPAIVTISVGGTVLWQNAESDDSDAHNVISRDYRWASSDFLPGESYAHTFTAPGEYRYFCDLHGGMTGRVIVQ